MTNFYSPFVENVRIAVEAIASRYTELQRKHNLLRKQYGVASRTIHELRAENALLRERSWEKNQVVDDVLTDIAKFKSNNTPSTWDNPTIEPPHTLTLRSTQGYYNLYNGGRSNTFIIKHGEYGTGAFGDRWWRIAPKNQNNTHATWEYWVNNFGPFEVVNETD